MPRKLGHTLLQAIRLEVIVLEQQIKVFGGSAAETKLGGI
jgi:hypothetical protein